MHQKKYGYVKNMRHFAFIRSQYLCIVTTKVANNKFILRANSTFTQTKEEE